MTIYIPEWALWVLGLGVGIPVLFALCLFAWFGLVMFEGFRK